MYKLELKLMNTELHADNGFFFFLINPDLVLLEPGPETGHGALVGVPREDGVAAVAPGVVDELEDDLRPSF